MAGAVTELIALQPVSFNQFQARQSFIGFSNME